MKNLICFLILLAFGGFVFVVGWTQIKVKPETCAIVQSKTKGINPNPVIPGKFSWNWEFLLPGNAVLNSFKIQPLNTTKTISGTIPVTDYSGISYDYLNYSFTFDISIVYTIDSIYDLLENNIISNQEDLDKYVENAASQIAQSAAQYYLKKAKENPGLVVEYIKRDDILRNLNLYKDFPDLDLTVFALTNYKLPDYTAYNRLNYQSYKTPELNHITDSEAADPDDKDSITEEEN